jgi:hypothetical protein
MVEREVWEQAWGKRPDEWGPRSTRGILCIECLERRIGRTLTLYDFTNAPINGLCHRFRKSDRLRDRLTRRVSNS